MELGNVCKDREMIEKIEGEGSIEKKSIIYCGFDTSCKQLQIWLLKPANLPFSYDFWIVLGFNFQMRVVPSLDQVYQSSEDFSKSVNLT